MKGCLSLVVGVVVLAAVIGAASGTDHSSTTTTAAETAESAKSPPSKPSVEEAPHLKTGSGTGTGANDCGHEIYGSRDTSCPFAVAVDKAFVALEAAAAVPPASVSAYSPVTRRKYSLHCAIHSDNEVECSTGNAIVSFRLPSAPIPMPTPAEGAVPSEGEDSVGSVSHGGDAKFCEEHTCIGSFTTEPGTVVECEDGTYSHSGGISGACSDHGGVAREE